jgi:WD repeat-containing protein 42A
MIFRQLSGQPISYIHQSMAQLDLVRRFELSHKLKGHDGCVNSIHFNEGGNLLASGSDDLKIFIWDWEKKRKAYSFKSGHTQNVFQSRSRPVFIPFTGQASIFLQKKCLTVQRVPLGSCIKS